MMMAVLLLSWALAAPAAPDAAEMLASARGLYASAAYEEALTALDGVDTADPGLAIEVERYRALCFFALGKPDEARAAMTKLVERDPLYVPAEADVPPRLIAMLHEIRRDRLPAIARRNYAEIRGSLTAGASAASVPALEKIVRMASDPDVSGVEGMEDLRLLADGFLTLAKAKAPPDPAAAGAGSSPAQPPATGAAPPARPLYTAADAVVRAPEAVQQQMPTWSRNRATRTGMTFSGYIRVIIDEYGRVESAALLRSIHPLYDQELLRAAQDWRFNPASKDGQPVRYLKVIQIKITDR